MHPSQSRPMFWQSRQLGCTHAYENDRGAREPERGRHPRKKTSNRVPEEGDEANPSKHQLLRDISSDAPRIARCHAAKKQLSHDERKVSNERNWGIREVPPVRREKVVRILGNRGTPTTESDRCNHRIGRDRIPRSPLRHRNQDRPGEKAGREGHSPPKAMLQAGSLARSSKKYFFQTKPVRWCGNNQRSTLSLIQNLP